MDDHGHPHDDHDHSHDDHGHSHGLLGHHHHHGGGHGAPGAIRRAMAITALFMLIEAAGGWYANSLALLTDAAHMLTDVGALLLSLFVIWLSRRPSTKQMSFGYHRAEILGALASGLAIWVIAGYLVYEAVLRMSDPPEVNGRVVLVVAAIGLCANLGAMKMLFASKDDNMNVRAAYLHMLSDCLGSLGAVVAGGVLWATGWRPIDPIITLVFSVLMVASSWSLIKEAVGVLMESAPSHVDPHEVQSELEGIEGVKEVHDLHIWTVSSGRLALSVHLIVGHEGGTHACDAESLLERANGVLGERYGIRHTTIQVEHADRFRSDRCYDCASG